MPLPLCPVSVVTAAARDGIRHLRIAELACPNAVADADQLAVPIVRRQPDFDLDVRIRRWRHRRFDTAECGQILVGRIGHAGRERGARGRLLERARGNKRGGSYLAVAQRQIGERAAVCCCCWIGDGERGATRAQGGQLADRE
jgi:hypothetical protein